MTEAQRVESDTALQQNFLSLPQLDRLERVLLFAGMGHEVDTRPIIEGLLARGKHVLLPRCLEGGGLEERLYRPEKLVRHRWGMWEPDESCPVEDAELILVPALCYDRAGYRLGRGGGYYDRLLAHTNAMTVGLCRDALLVDRVPRDAWDRKVALVVTETSVFETKE